MNGNGTGTTAAVNQINPALFNHANITLVYDPRTMLNKGRTNSTISYSDNAEIRAILVNMSQSVQFTTGGSTSRHPPGSVFATTIQPTDDKFISVYHIKGVNLSIGSVANVEQIIAPLVTTYYTELLLDYTTNIIPPIPSTQTPVLHLSPVPGDNYGGGVITQNAMRTAVRNFVNTYAGRPFQINLGIPLGNLAPPAAAAAATRRSVLRKNRTLKNRR
jgi:hypothetical protein